MNIIALLAAILIQLEHATTPDTWEKGLGGREVIAEETGMAFTFPEKQIHRFWAYGCLCDVDVAFLDDEKRIVQLYTLKAYPMMNNASYAKQFFARSGVVSSQPVRYVVEMRGGWFKDHKVGLGAQIHYEVDHPQARVE